MRKKFEELEFKDGFLFAAAMADEELCRMVLERILEIPIRAVRVQSENTFLFNSDYRGIRLDVFADDGAGTVFDVEMQTVNRGNLPKRSRLYQAHMDVGALKPGDSFDALPESFIIFLCTFDPFGEGRFRYTFRAQCLESGGSLEDGACRVFLNTAGAREDEVPPELVQFLRYVGDGNGAGNFPDDPLISRIQERIAGLKKSRRMEERYMLFAEMLGEERKEGKREGREEGKKLGENRILELLEKMEEAGLSPDISRLKREPGYLEEMLEKFHLSDFDQ